ncbi:TetR/AcrR family transcriptional regulator [Rhodobacteraceae bacterium RKSG542]|uniref:TetR/AcrR family transcriptional regulator n=1 Tax=Pseudovibrio flavus TaxID=2529854 RepID=UPI0012BB8545|nr:TetR/AcrR family transcriptional regulator [Pseudovibrio flavus]MTI15639.1 TetR/AcrR family transcriptional regulator [Pseudovibrio flavus]
MAGNSSLSPDDWIKAAFRALTEKGPSAIRAEALARDLKVTKGSFYWHYKDVPALKVAMLKHWEHLATQQIIEHVKAVSKRPEGRLYDLVAVISEEISADYGGNGAEAAVRNWARFDPVARECIVRVDKKRLQFVEKLFLELPETRDKASLLSELLYAALIGAEEVAPQNVHQCLKLVLDLALGSRRDNNGHLRD